MNFECKKLTKVLTQGLQVSLSKMSLVGLFMILNIAEREKRKIYVNDFISNQTILSSGQLIFNFFFF